MLTDREYNRLSFLTAAIVGSRSKYYSELIYMCQSAKDTNSAVFCNVLQALNDAIKIAKSDLFEAGKLMLTDSDDNVVITGRILLGAVQMYTRTTHN